MKRIVCLTLLILLGTHLAFSDIAGPPANVVPENTPKAKSLDAKLHITMRSNVSVATLSVPKAQLKSLRAQLEEIDNQSDDTASSGSLSRTQTIASGLLISLAMLFGGLWFARSGKSATKSGKTVAVLAAVGIASASTVVYANVGPPPGARSITGNLFDQKMFEPYGFVSGKIKVVVDSDTTNVYSLEVPNPPAKSGGEE